MKTVAICSAANQTYSIGLAVALVSALRHCPSGTQPTIYVLDGGMREKSWNWLVQSLSGTGRAHELVRLRPEMTQFAGLPQDWGSSVMTYARLALSEMVTADRIFYIDSDLLIQSDWTPIWEVDLGDAIIAAAPDVITRTLGGERLPLEKFGMEASAPYLQAGMMIIDLRRWRNERVSEKVVNYLRDHPAHSQFWDQSALNVVLYGRWKALPGAWNTPAWWADAEMEGCTLEAPLLHFVGPHKPWMYGHHHSGSARRFYSWLDRTTWRGWRPSALRQALKWIKYQLVRFLAKIR